MALWSINDNFTLLSVIASARGVWFTSSAESETYQPFA
jgi:hypothetical protein